jgi:redox-sensing transcriptional repressor
MKKPIPDIVIGRLPVYLRALQHMLDAGRDVTSSQELGERLGISAAQIRKDLSQFGEFGKQGTGYTIEFLAQQIQGILKIEEVWEIALIGAGDMGNALASYQGFNQRGFHISKIFDSDPNKIGKKIGDYKVLNIETMESEIKKSNIKMAMLAVPASVAQEVTDKLVESGIKAILNYAPVSISVPQGVRKQYIDPAVHLQRMSYYLK